MCLSEAEAVPPPPAPCARVGAWLLSGRLARRGGRGSAGPCGQPDPLTRALHARPPLHRRLPVLDVAGPHLPSAFSVLWPRESAGSLCVPPALG